MIPVHQIEAQPIARRYARGWHCLGLADDYKNGKPHALDIFGTHLVAYQGEDGQVHVIGGHCPHMGADLSRGFVKGNSLVCPFHHWSWDSQGHCDHIPYCDRIPPKAKVQAWPTCEQNKLLFVWNDPERNGPTPEVAIPRIGQCFSSAWSDWHIVKWTININCRELIDNISDMAHFSAVHAAPATYFANIFEQHKATQILVGTSPRLAADQTLTSHSSNYGPACQFSVMHGEMDGLKMESILMNTHVPIDLDRFDLRFGVMVKKQPGLSEAQNAKIVAAYVKATQEAFQEDDFVWEGKARVDNPLLCANDGPIYQLRQWYQQFYTDVADVPPQQRQVYELGDTTQRLPMRHVFG